MANARNSEGRAGAPGGGRAAGGLRAGGRRAAAGVVWKCSWYISSWLDSAILLSRLPGVAAILRGDFAEVLAEGIRNGVLKGNSHPECPDPIASTRSAKLTAIFLVKLWVLWIDEPRPLGEVCRPRLTFWRIRCQQKIPKENSPLIE